MNISDPTLVIVKKKISKVFNLVKNCFDESDEIEFLTKIPAIQYQFNSFFFF